MHELTTSSSMNISFHRSNILDVPHGMFNRHQGVSQSPFSSLNVSFGVGDDPRHISANRQRIKKALGITSFLSAKQVHGVRVYAGINTPADMEVSGYDALITTQKGIGLLIQQADCQAILIHDPVRKVIAAIHCGWRGSVANIARTTIEVMQQQYRTEPADLRVAISPSLGPCCAEFINYRSELPREFQEFRESANHFNFWKISTAQLTEAGVASEKIDIGRICTCCNQDYFSYRRSNKNGNGLTGRNASVICLP